MSPQDNVAIADLPARGAPNRSTREALWLGEGQLQAGDFHRAEQAFRQILQREPWCAEAWFFLGLLGQKRNDLVGAVERYEHALCLAPDLAEAHNNLGVVLQDQGKLHEAEERFREAIRLMPDYPEAHNNLGNALQDQGRFAEAVPAYHRALHFQPGYVDALKHLGNALRALGRLPEAIECYNEGLRLDPDHVLLHTARAMVWIQMGDLVQGFAECEWRLRGQDLPIHRFTQPVWDGMPLDGRTILICTEQGLGDTLQFIRYATRAADRGGRVVVACPPILARILGSCPGVDEVVSEGSSLPQFDCYAPVMSLAHILGTTLGTIPAEVPYLAAKPACVERWRAELGGVRELKIGVVWQGNPIHNRDRERSFRLAQLEPVARVPGVRLFSLQKNFGLDQLETLPDGFSVTDLGRRINDLAETAAVMKNLDLVISADSSPAHLAGALAVPVWMVLPSVCDWRWMTNREDTPWYPTMRLFRQRRFGDWDGGVRSRRTRAGRASSIGNAAWEPGETMIQNSLSLAGAYLQAGDWPRAELACRQVLAVDPSVGDAWFILGVASQILGKIHESVGCYRNAVQLVPYNAEAWNNLGASYSSLRRPEEAEACIRQALRLAPDYAQAHNNLGNALQAQGKHDEAITCYRRALHFKPDYHAAYDHLGLVLHAQGRLAEAVDCYGQALRLAPEYAVAHMNRALAWLQMGDFARGWVEYEWRWRCPEHPVPDLAAPVWDGTPLDGRTILLRAEQGLGDTLQFIRYARLVEHQGGRVVVSCPGSLARLLARTPGVDRVVPEEPPDFEFACHAPLMSLPRILGTTLQTIPAEVPYISPDPALSLHWREELEAIDGLKVGIAWQGNPDHKKDRLRSFKLDRFEPLARIPGVRLFNLQKGFGSEQLEKASGRLPITDLGPRLDDFMDTAAVVANLDLLILPDTALAHLAGALGVPAWVALPFASDWRWLLAREDTPWYPTMRLFRQARWGDWDDVFGRIERDLTCLAETR